MSETTEREITNDADVIDSRDVIARIARLEEIGTPDEDEREPGDNAYTRLDQDEAHELDRLRRLASEASQYAADWEYGETLIRDTYFEDYARELAEDIIGTVTREYTWPMSHIDWPAAARALQQDYTPVDFDGVTYWIR